MYKKSYKNKDNYTSSKGSSSKNKSRSDNKYSGGGSSRKYWAGCLGGYGSNLKSSIPFYFSSLNPKSPHPTILQRRHNLTPLINHIPHNNPPWPKFLLPPKIHIPNFSIQLNNKSFLKQFV